MATDKVEKVKPVAYLLGDETKTPVDMAKQKPGTVLMLVSPNGRDLPVVVGVATNNTKEDIEKAVKLSKAKDKKYEAP